MKSDRYAHVSDVMKVAEGDNTAHDQIIRESWQRCVSNHQLDPSSSPEIYVHTESEVQHRRKSLEDFLRTARYGLESLYQEVSGLGYLLLLTDPNGVTIDYIGDPNQWSEHRNAGLHLGSLWSEAHAGTNGVGTCIATGRALVVHQSDHFSQDHIDLTCTAAPIFNCQGELAAILDISALRSPEEKASQQMALSLVNQCAHRIENASLLNGYSRSWMLKLSRSPEFLCVDPEFILALDETGRISGFNNRAASVIRKELELSDNADIKGCRFEDVFDCKLSRLSTYVRPTDFDRTAIRLLHSGTTLFLHAHPPRPKIRKVEQTPVEKLPKPLAELTGGDQNLLVLFRRIAKLSSTPVSLLVQGETGSGKERLAKAVHDVSGRGAFVPVNCAAIPETLIESELFGYEAGAFTGARAKGKLGLIARANGGTLFLDEIGDMPIQLQTRLLRALAEKEIVPLGGSKPIHLDIRVISATHRDLKAAIKAGDFREDLYYRLNGFEFTLPALRERTDLEWLIETLVAERAPPGRVPVFTNDALEVLHNHSWPGNIRELLNVIDLALAVSNDGVVTPEDLPENVFARRPTSNTVVVLEAGPDAPEFNMDAEMLRERLVRRNWNVSQVARDLHLDRTTVHRRMKKLGIVAPNNSSRDD